jgi:hypothetical protein
MKILPKYYGRKNALGEILLYYDLSLYRRISAKAFFSHSTVVGFSWEKKSPHSPIGFSLSFNLLLDRHQTWRTGIS